jgi:hypothetical protein
MTTFATLKSDIDTFYPHSDVTEGLKNTFVQSCEAEIRRKLRVRQMETSATLTQSAQSTALPTGFIQFRSVAYTGTYKRDLDFLPPARFRSSGILDSSGGDPSAYTIEGDNLVVAPWSVSVDLHGVYLAMFDALSGDTDTNWALTNAYDLYLYGSLKHAAIWAQDQGATVQYATLFNQIVTELNREHRWARFSGSKLVRTGGRSP